MRCVNTDTCLYFFLPFEYTREVLREYQDLLQPPASALSPTTTTTTTVVTATSTTSNDFAQQQQHSQ